MPALETLTVRELKRTETYKKIPPSEKKSALNKKKLISLMKKYEKAPPRRSRPRGRASPPRRSRSRRSRPRRSRPRRRASPPRRSRPRRSRPRRRASPRRITLVQKRKDCREKGLVYDRDIDDCRPSKRGQKRPPPARSFRRSSRGRNCIERSNLPLGGHQIKIARHLENHRGIIAVHGIGTGKTLTAVATSQCFLDKFPGSKVIVISPSSLLANFKKGMEEYGVDSRNKKYEFYSFEAFMKKQDVYYHCKNNLLIVDEAHNLRTIVSGNKGKKVSKALMCASKASRVLLLTATPMVNSPADLNNLLALVKGRSPMTETEWEAMYDSPYARRAYMGCMFSVYSREKDDSNYPRRVDKEIELEMSEKYYREYKEIEEKNEEKLEKAGMTNPWAFLSGLRTSLLRIENSAKIDYVIKEVKKKVGEGRKVIIYSNFVGAGIDNVAKRLKSAGVDFYEFTGKTPQGKRREYVAEYNSGEISALLITKAAGEGIDLKGTNSIFILDPPWNEASLEQAIGRAIRYKSHADLPPKERYVEVYTMYNVKPKKYMLDDLEKPSADSMIKTMIQNKREMNRYVINLLGEYSIEKNRC